MSRLSRSIIWRALLTNAAVLALVLLLLVVTPVTVSARIQLTELGILLVGTLGMIAINWLLLRRAMAPLRRLSEQMERLDPREDPVGRKVDSSGIREIDAVTRAFAAMAERLARERRETARAVLAGQEGERLRVSRELHDEVGQSLIALTLQAERASESADPEAAEQFSSIANGLRFNLDELRRIAHELRPEMLDDLGLINALIALTHGVRAHGELIVDRDLPERLPPLPGESELVIYRVAQEALTNAARHSGASRVGLRLFQHDGQLVLAVRDDGRGLADSPAGAGIQGMRERALLIGGRVELRSEPEGGTSVELAVPLGGDG